MVTHVSSQIWCLILKSYLISSEWDWWQCVSCTVVIRATSHNAYRVPGMLFVTKNYKFYKLFKHSLYFISVIKSCLLWGIGLFSLGLIPVFLGNFVCIDRIRRYPSLANSPYMFWGHIWFTVIRGWSFRDPREYRCETSIESLRILIVLQSLFTIKSGLCADACWR